jgi:regulator of sirC expression with transglutaminase-like and TPR domain
VTLSAEHYVAISSRQFLTRMLANLKGVYWRREQWESVIGAIDRLLALNPKAATEWRDRGVAWSNLGEVQRGLGDWEHYLTEFPDAEDHEVVRGHLRRARQKLSQLN